MSNAVNHLEDLHRNLDSLGYRDSTDDPTHAAKPLGEFTLKLFRDSIMLMVIVQGFRDVRTPKFFLHIETLVGYGKYISVWLMRPFINLPPMPEDSTSFIEFANKQDAYRYITNAYIRPFYTDEFEACVTSSPAGSTQICSTCSNQLICLTTQE